MSEEVESTQGGLSTGPMGEATVARPWWTNLLAAGAIAFAVLLLLYFPDRDDGSGAMLGGLSALIASMLGLAALAQCRPVPHRTSAEHLRLAILSLGLGVAFGVANLGANYGMAIANSAIYEQMVARWSQFSPLSAVVKGPIMEEIVFRLGLLSGLAWLTARFTDNPRTIFRVAVGVSALTFGIAHIFYGGVAGPTYMTGMALKSSIAGLLLGWMFWRWGLPFAIVCHSAANGIHLLLEPFLF
ncbi:MAG: CPBP family intramembrane metalloprotease [Holophagales bacterium]|nr:CPBP family intramembrane metalloprotease [Holophagales bacterium]MYF05278.1 CPBP family intramembrane metalloprotease [Holophagales bacterium]MYJ25536.1 CPBP family intramembrane metalloprotease [Holophagales bacterium]